MVGTCQRNAKFSGNQKNAPSTDAEDQTTTYVYDALNRVTTVTYHDSRVVSYGYDAGANGVGQLNSIVESRANASLASQILYAYDAQARVLSDTRSFGNASFVTQYAYDAAGRISSLTYPSGSQLSYGVDALADLIVNSDPVADIGLLAG